MTKTQTWKAALLQARKKWYLANYQAARDHGTPIKMYSDRTANGLTACICDFLKFNGHYANRISSTGLPRNINGKVVWTTGNTNKGTADISAIINGKPVSIEVKIGADRMSEAQHKEKARIEQAGGTYIVAKDMQSFFEWYTDYFKQ